ncbi:hypothetical protein OUHCRE2_46450 [Enterobacter asburiae]
MDSVHHIWCPLSSQEYQDLPDGAETTLTLNIRFVPERLCFKKLFGELKFTCQKIAVLIIEIAIKGANQDKT